MSEETITFLNYYECHVCGETWYDTADCMCNDRCPTCNAEIEPTTSSELYGEKGYD